MQLDKIITLANKKVQLRFMALERSLRATGCTLPLLVIPYDGETFPLPENASWWSLPDLQDWLGAEKAHPMYRKYQCLTTDRYHYVDSDVIFLRNPEEAMARESGFVASCGHWRDASHTVTAESTAILRGRSSLWQRNIFNTGQFACDQILYSAEDLKKQCLDPRYVETCLRLRFHEQPGINLLVNLVEVPIHNLTLPPLAMESTWAGDYAGADYAATWTPEEKKPYLIHWAGCHENFFRPIDQLFLDYLTGAEREQFERETAELRQSRLRDQRSLRSRARRWRRSLRGFADAWRE
jgi:hypothetical protein